MNDPILEKIIFLIKKYLNEESPTNSLSGGNIAGTIEAGDTPPVDFRKNKYKRIPYFYRGSIRKDKSNK